MKHGRGLIVAFICSCTLLLSACTTQRYTLQHGTEAYFPNAETMQPFFLSGIGQTQHIGTAQICRSKDKIAAIEFQQSALDVLLAVLTGGIFTPRTVKIYCAN